jgi:hypothetical protein
MRNEAFPVAQRADGPATYEFHVAGPIGPLVRAALPELAAGVVPTFTVLTGTTTHDDLQRLLDALAANGSPATELRTTTH